MGLSHFRYDCRGKIDRGQQFIVETQTGTEIAISARGEEFSMRIIKLSLLVLFLITVIPSFQTKAEAYSGFSFGLGYYPRSYGYYRPYYRPYYYGRPYYWGSPYFAGGYYSPYYYGGYGYGGYGGYGGYYGSFFGDIRTEVKPKEAKVFVDGAYVGNVDSFDGWWQRLQLAPGKHRIVFRAEGYVPFAVTVRALPGQDVKIKQQMQPGEDVISEKEMLLDEAEREQSRNDRGYENDRGYGNGYDSDRPSQRQRDPNNPYGWDRNKNSTPAPKPGNNLSMEQDTNRLTLVLKVEPKDATIYVDENYYGTSHANASGEVRILLPQGVHKIDRSGASRIRELRTRCSGGPSVAKPAGYHTSKEIAPSKR